MRTRIIDISGQNHVVIGAASGIGRATALRLADLGATVACLDMDVAGAEDVVREMGTANGVALEIDVRDEASVVGALGDAVARLGQLHAVVNCAGVTGTTGILSHEVDVSDFDEVYAVNLRGALLVSKAVLPHMADAGYGRLVHVASISGKEGNAGMAAYSSTKAGLIGLVKVMGKEYATSGVTVNAIAPAVVRTPMVDALPEEQVSYMTDKIPMQRCGELDEVADMIAWAASPACSFTTGFTFDLTGGRATY